MCNKKINTAKGFKEFLKKKFLREKKFFFQETVVFFNTKNLKDVKHFSNSVVLIDLEENNYYLKTIYFFLELSLEKHF